MKRNSVSEPDLSNVDDERIRKLPLFLSVSNVGTLLQLRRTKTREVIGRPDFPRPIALGGRHRVWMTKEVLDWMDLQPRVQERPVPASLMSLRRYRDGQLVGRLRADSERRK